jgi:hypothetical protein
MDKKELKQNIWFDFGFSSLSVKWMRIKTQNKVPTGMFVFYKEY